MSVSDRIKNYLGNGGLFNPEMMEHDKVRDLILACREEIDRLNIENGKLKAWCNHKPDCETAAHGNCDCGYYESWNDLATAP